jgi:hypothetical protein
MRQISHWKFRWLNWRIWNIWNKKNFKKDFNPAVLKLGVATLLRVTKLKKGSPNFEFEIFFGLFDQTSSKKRILLGIFTYRG